MKTMKLLFTLIFAAAFTTFSFGQGIDGTAHDFEEATWNTTDQICIVCHTPHNADVTVANAPLWNREVTAATFTLYTSTTLDATTGQPGEASKLCLSCHDGTIALENFSGVTTGINLITGRALVGTALENDHPISITYDAALAAADGGLYNPITANSGLGGSIDDDLLFGGQMQCASCHDVHNDGGNPRLLRVANNGSALCLTCHNK